MAGAANDVLINVLQKLNLGHLTENFQREKITVDQISKLSRQEMEFLGVNDSKAMMSLRLQCLHYGSNPPPRIPGTQSCGAPHDEGVENRKKRSPTSKDLQCSGPKCVMAHRY